MVLCCFLGQGLAAFSYLRLGDVNFVVKEEVLGQGFLRLSMFSSPLFIMAQQPVLGQGLHIMETSCSHSDTPQTVGRLWTSDWPNAGTSTCQHTTFTRDGHP